MEVSVGIISYKDKKLPNLLKDFSNQKLEDITIKEIIVISDINTENKKWDYLTKEFKNVHFIFQKRKGKYMAVNKFLDLAKSPILILSSGDIRLKRNTIEKLTKPFQDNKVGIVSARPIPRLKNKKIFLDYTINLIWKLHHQISMKTPKFGEIIAFRNLGFKLPETSVDEEIIASIITKKGYEKKYASNSIIYNSGPTNFFDLIQQRRRIFCGHMNLKKNYNYNVPTTNVFWILENLAKIVDFKIIRLTVSILIEVVARTLGYIDFLLGKKYYKWKIIKK